jgi:hypothetical protein
MQEYSFYANPPFPDKDIAEGNLSVENCDDMWKVFAGDLCIYHSDSSACLEAFVRNLCVEAGLSDEVFFRLKAQWSSGEVS